mmetsp:Transcript_4956/g.9340  ORF Transcript_4956/g.9340 Transcript_4956/m.9340 type:complete len:739 (+) Transcript_4956:622-2838(+)
MQHIINGHSFFDQLQEPPSEDLLIDTSRRPSHKRHVSGLSVGVQEVDDASFEVSEPVTPHDADSGGLKRTKSMNRRDMSNELRATRSPASPNSANSSNSQDDDITAISHRLGSRRISIASCGDDDITRIVGGSLELGHAGAPAFFNQMYGSNQDRVKQEQGQEQEQEQEQATNNFGQQRQAAGNEGLNGLAATSKNGLTAPLNHTAQANGHHNSGGTNGSNTGSNTRVDTSPQDVQQPNSMSTVIDGWSLEMDACLRTAMGLSKGVGLAELANLVHMTPKQCDQRWQELCKPNDRKGTWTDAEDARLMQQRKESPKRNWSDIAWLIPGRSPKQCRERWCYNLDPSIDKGKWRQEEDKILIKTQLLLGNKWAQIATMLPGRTENAVKTRFKSIKRAEKREWSKDEDDLIMHLHNENGSRWDMIADKLPGRTKNAVKTRYRLLSKGGGTEAPQEGAPNQILRTPNGVPTKDAASAIAFEEQNLPILHTKPQEARERAATGTGTGIGAKTGTGVAGLDSYSHFVNMGPLRSSEGGAENPSLAGVKLESGNDVQHHHQVGPGNQRQRHARHHSMPAIPNPFAENAPGENTQRVDQQYAAAALGLARLAEKSNHFQAQPYENENYGNTRGYLQRSHSTVDPSMIPGAAFGSNVADSCVAQEEPRRNSMSENYIAGMNWGGYENTERHASPGHDEEWEETHRSLQLAVESLSGDVESAFLSNDTAPGLEDEGGDMDMFLDLWSR